MGRSGGQKKLLSKTQPSTRSKSYLPGPDHDELFFYASEIWMGDASVLLNEQLLKTNWGRQLEKRGFKDSLIYQKLQAAFLHEVETSVLDSGPVYRGQPFLADHPNDRIRSWSSSLNVVIDDFLNNLILESGDSFQSIDLDEAQFLSRIYLEGKDKTGLFQDGQKLIATVYLIEEPKNGLSLNSPRFQAKRKEQALEMFEQGVVGGVIYSQEDGQWLRVSESSRLNELKQEAAKFCLDNLDKKEIVEIIGLDNYQYPLQENDSLDDLADLGLRMQIARATPLKDIDRLLEKAGSQKELNNWREEVNQIRSNLESYSSLYTPLDDCYLNEDEVIIAPKSVSGMKRVEVVLAENEQEVVDLNKQVIEEKIQQAIARKEFIDPDQVPPGQKTLF